MYRLLLAVAALGAISCGTAGQQNKPRMRMTPKEIVTESSDAIVKLEVGECERGPDGKAKDPKKCHLQFGTGFIVDASGLIATNLHVVAGNDKILVKLHDGTPHAVVEIAGMDPSRDLALLRIKPAKKLQTLRLGDSSQMTAGDQIIAIGHQLGTFDYSVTSGLVSQVRTVCTPESEPACPPGGLVLLQIDAAIAQGSSGGPLFNLFGEVVGVTTAIIADAQAINLAVPSNYIKPLVAEPQKLALAEFVKETSREDKTDDEPRVSISRQVPQHDVSVLDGCNDQQLVDVVGAITSAIDIGAPLYNKGEIEACFRIYEGTSTKLERDPPCKGVGKAFGDGLLRASTLATYKEKAWALRDTFDGLLDVAKKRGVTPKL